MASYGYLHAASYAISGFDNNLGLTNNNMPRKMFFGAPTNAGTATTLRFPLYKRGTPPVGSIDVELWSVKSGGDPFTDVLSGPNWLQIGSASLNPSSVTGVDSVENATWIDIPLAAPVYLDSAPDDLPLIDAQEAGLRYAIRLNHTSASSTSAAANALAIAYNSAISHTFGFHARSGEAQYNSAFDWQDMPFAIYGLITPSSKYRDAPLMVFDPGSTRPGLMQFTETTFNRIGVGFTAVGSMLTRAKFDVELQGLKQMQMFAGIWTNNVSSDQPNACVGTSDLVVVNSGTVAASYFSTIDMTATNFGIMFVFSGGIAVNSGSKYWVSMEVLSYQQSVSSEYVGLRRALNSKRHVYWDLRSAGAIWNTESSTPYAEVWYRDGQTELDWSVDKGLGAYYLPNTVELINPGGETGTNTGWTATFAGSGMNVASLGGSLVTPRNGGFLFFGGNNSISWSGQWIDVPSSLQSFVDQGIVKGFLMAYVQCFSGTDSDEVGLIADCYDASSNWLSNAHNPLTDFEPTSWQTSTLEIYIPKNTRRLHVGQRAARRQGTELSAYTDDFSFVFEQGSYHVDNALYEKGNNQNSFTVVSGSMLVLNSIWGTEQPRILGSGAWFNFRKTVDIPSSHWAAINSQTARFVLSYLHGDFTTTGDKGRIIVTFADSAGTIVGSFSLPTSTAVGSIAYMPRSFFNTIPQSAALANVIIEGQRVSGTNLDSYNSRINFLLMSPSSVPPQGYIYPILTIGGFTRSYPQTSRKYPELIDRKYPL